MIGLIDKFLKTQVVECSAVANWIFSPEMTSEFNKYGLSFFNCLYVFTIVSR